MYLENIDVFVAINLFLIWIWIWRYIYSLNRRYLVYSLWWIRWWFLNICIFLLTIFVVIERYISRKVFAKDLHFFFVSLTSILLVRKILWQSVCFWSPFSLFEKKHQIISPEQMCHNCFPDTNYHFIFSIQIKVDKEFSFKNPTSKTPWLTPVKDGITRLTSSSYSETSFWVKIFEGIYYTIIPRPVFCLLLGISSDYAQAITHQVTGVTCPVIGRAQAELTASQRQKMGPAPFMNSIWRFTRSNAFESQRSKCNNGYPFITHVYMVIRLSRCFVISNNTHNYYNVALVK